MDFASLKTFLHVAATGSFSRAAALGGSTQSAVSKRISGLEHELAAAWTLRAEVYRKDYADLRTRYENLFDPVTVLPELEVDRRCVEPRWSWLYGVEGSLRWQAGEPWSGWVGYTWSEANDQFDGFSAPPS